MTEFIDVDAYRCEIDLITPTMIDLSQTIEIDLTNDEPDPSPSPPPRRFHPLGFSQSSVHNTSQSSSLLPHAGRTSPQKRKPIISHSQGPPIKKRTPDSSLIPRDVSVKPSRPTASHKMPKLQSPRAESSTDPYARRTLAVHASTTDSKPFSAGPYLQASCPTDTTADSSLTRQARRKRVFTLIYDSDGFEVETKTVKRGKICESSDSDEEHASSHAGFSLLDPEPWKPLPTREHRLDFEDDMSDAMQHLTVTNTPACPIRRRPKVSNLPPTKSTLYPPSNDCHIWDALRLSEVIPRPKSSRIRLPNSINAQSKTRRCSLDHALQLHALKLTASFRKAPGSINKITQHEGTVVICSSAAGGQPDESDEEENLYNREGSLIVWHEGKAYTVTGHYRRKQGHNFEKHYTVNDVKFDPRDPTTIVSSGNDGAVRVWAFDSDDEDEPLCLDDEYRYNHVPHDLAFKPGESVLAVASQKIHVYPDLTATNRWSNFSLAVAPEDSNHSTGPISWGLEGTSNFLFASSEPADEGITGFHRAFDLYKQKVLYQFDASEAGDALSVKPDGASLALCTRGAAGSHILRMYDIQRQNRHAVQSIRLDAFPDDSGGEVNVATFSSDGIYLAIARSDNVTHIYDSRMLAKGALHIFKHSGPCRAGPGSESYGIVQAQWVESPSRRLGLVTGGDDGCVRLWDVSKASSDPSNGTSIAETDFDIGYFSLGDPFKRENSLVIGDSGGGIAIFDTRGGPPW